MPTQAERDRAVRLYTVTRLPVTEIARRMNVSRSTVHRWLQGSGVDLRGPMGPRTTYEAGDEDQIGDLAEILGRVVAALTEQREAIEAQTEVLRELLSRLQPPEHG